MENTPAVNSKTLGYSKTVTQHQVKCDEQLNFQNRNASDSEMLRNNPEIKNLHQGLEDLFEKFMILSKLRLEEYVASQYNKLRDNMRVSLKSFKDMTGDLDNSSNDYLLKSSPSSESPQ